MATIDLTGFDTQNKPMYAIEDVLRDYTDGFLGGAEALSIIRAITTEWVQ
jgi:hypothetical protein